MYVGTLFAWPDDVQRLAFIALALALPAVLVVAWYHGDRGEQRVTVAELWRQDWWYHRDWGPTLASVRSTAEFRTLFAQIEVDMRRQREAIHQ